VSLILVRYGEIGLKGHNRNWFIKRLRQNIKACLREQAVSGRVWSEGQRVYIELDGLSAVLPALQRVFGIVSLSPVEVVRPDIESMEQAALALARRVGLGPEMSYHIAARRSDKSFPYISPEINRLIGGFVQEHTGARVDLSDEADLIIGIEVQPNRALVYGEVIPGPGGLPLGTQGRAIALISGGIDSPVAAWLMMRRGCGIIPLHFSQTQEGTARVLELIEQLARWSYGWHLRPIVVSHQEVFGPVYQRLSYLGAERWSCIFCKRVMVATAARLCEEHKAQAIVTGDNLGQVASQTLDNLEAISYGCPKPILRPLLGYDKIETMNLARRIGTYEISAWRAEGCPFLPPNPLTRATLPKLKELLRDLGDVAGLNFEVFASNP